MTAKGDVREKIRSKVEEKLRPLTLSPSEWSEGLWAYVHVDDLARAVEQPRAGGFRIGFRQQEPLAGGGR